VSFTAETWRHRTCFIFQQPDYSETIRNPFLKPFTKDVWTILGIFGLVFAFTLNLVEGLYEYGERGKDSTRNCEMFHALIGRSLYLSLFSRTLIASRRLSPAIVDKSKLLPTRIDHNCSIKQMKGKHHITHKEQIINQSHKSRSGVIERSKNVAKWCTLLVSKSRHNGTSMRKTQRRRKTRQDVESLRLSQNQQSRSVFMVMLNHLLDGVLIFVSALSQQGERARLSCVFKLKSS
jgi:hypothetical protein